MKSANDVSLLFDGKATSWNGKYSQDGPLAYRVTVFSGLLSVRVKPGAAVLDFGGGTGAISGALAARGYRMTVCDVSEQMILAGKQIHAGRTIEWRRLSEDWKELPFAVNTFDAVIASSVFEYVDDIGHVLAESRRVLGPGGKLIFSAPNPAHPTRRLERVLRPAAALALAIPFVPSLPKIGSYLKYLRVSRHRLSAEGWRRKAAAAGLRAIDIQPAETASAPDQALIYLAFERTPEADKHI
jgi:ubiquinone/menaquinone biosynthesis C-methylase UbiE